MPITSSQLKKLRESKGVTQQGFADAIGKSRNTVATWEKDGGSVSKADDVILVCRYFNLPLDDYMSYEPVDNQIDKSEESREIDPSDLPILTEEAFQRWLLIQQKASTITLLDEIALRMISHTVADIFISEKEVDLDAHRQKRVRTGMEDAKEYLRQRIAS